MSNVSQITPYANQGQTSNAIADCIGAAADCIGVAAICVVGVTKAAQALAQWLGEVTPEDQAVLKNLEARRRQEQLDSMNLKPCFDTLQTPLSLVSRDLLLKDADSLLRSAHHMGYRIEQPAAVLKDAMETSLTFLRGPANERLVIERNARDRITLHAAQDEKPIHRLVRQHTLDRTVEHLKASGMTFETTPLKTGEVQIQAKAQGLASQGRSATIKAQVHEDGSVHVDVDNVKGSQCEKIVRDFANALSGEVTGMKKKDAYFQLPGEPVKIKAKV